MASNLALNPDHHPIAKKKNLRGAHSTGAPRVSTNLVQSHGRSLSRCAKRRGLDSRQALGQTVTHVAAGLSPIAASDLHHAARRCRRARWDNPLSALGASLRGPAPDDCGRSTTISDLVARALREDRFPLVGADACTDRAVAWLGKRRRR